MMSPQTPQTESPEMGLDADERALAEALRAIPAAEPSAELDARILAMAATAVAAASRADSATAVPVSLAHLRSRRRSRWGWGMGAAAAAALSALMLAPHWLDRSGIAPSFDAGSGLNRVAPAAPMAETADRLQPDKAMNVAKREAAPGTVALVADPATIAPAAPLRAPAPAPKIAETIEDNVEAAVGATQPKEVESVAASAAEPLIADDDRAIRHQGLRQREEVPVSNQGSSSAVAPADGAAKPRSNETALTSKPTALPATAPMDPVLAQIRQLIADKHTERALAAIAEWQRQHPALPLPDDVQRWWQAQAR